MKENNFCPSVDEANVRESTETVSNPQKNEQMQRRTISIATLKAICNIWVNWRFQEIDGRKTKIPLNPRTGCMAKSNNPDTWTSFDEAVRQQACLSADGIGLMFGKIDEEYAVCGIDIDAHHRDENTDAQEVIKLFNGTYVETSPSGNGYHVLFLAKPSEVPTVQEQGELKLDSKYYCKNLNNELECYIAGLTNRYFTFTGNKISETDDLVDMTPELRIFLEKYMKKENFTKSDDSPVLMPVETNAPVSESMPATTMPEIPSDWLEIARKAKNGDKFSALYDNGDVSLFNGDDSSADLALCRMLAFYLQGNSSAIDEAFRKSALYRDKWERTNYRQNTIQKAVEACNGTFYAPQKSGNRSGKMDFSSKMFFFNGMMQTVEQVRFFIQNHPFLEGDEKNCRISITRLYDFYVSRRRFLFARSDRSDNVRRFVYSHGVYLLLSDDDIKSDIQQMIFECNAKNFFRTSVVTEVFKMLLWTGQFTISEEMLNSDENIVNFRNGLLRLDTMQLIPHSPECFSTIQLPCAWYGDQPTPLFDEFMCTFTSGDAEKAQLLLEFMGGCLSNYDGSRFKKALIVWGEGNSGKSVLRNLIAKLIGENNQSGGSLAGLEDRFGRIELYQRRVYGSPDLGYINSAQTTIFKNITGGDIIPIEQKNQPAFQYKYKGFVWFGCNRLPKFPPDAATYDRFIIIRCSNVIPKERQDKLLIEKMLRESSGIVFKALMAFKNTIERGGFIEPAESRAIMSHYRVDNSLYIQFFTECCTMRPMNGNDVSVRDNCKCSDVHKALKAWCSINFPSVKMSRTHFIEELESSGIDCQVLRRNNGNRYYLFTLTQQAMNEFGISSDASYSYGYGYGYNY